nr:MAG TPA: hypothetical protein [Caudoviricetes sp.]DAS39946.1 MAG TPA: hypothetical protein [Caudoviricetes sp.]
MFLGLLLVFSFYFFLQNYKLKFILQTFLKKKSIFRLN